MKQRQIKFRAWIPTSPWDGAKSKMVICNSDAEEEDDYFCTGNKVFRTFNDWYAGYSIIEESDAEIMQFTGLFDKNGKEIYEGDIISDGQDKYLVWIEAGKMLMGGLNKEWDEFLVLGYPEKKEVIGNIYENPELLK